MTDRTINKDAEKPLTPKQAAFVREYVKDRNGTQAYMRASGTTNARTAAANSARMLGYANVRKALTALDAEATKDSLATADWVLNGLVAIAEDRENTASSRVAAFTRIGEHLGMWKQTDLETFFNNLPPPIRDYLRGLVADGKNAYVPGPNADGQSGGDGQSPESG